MVLPFNIGGPALRLGRSQAFPLPSPPVPTGRGVTPFNRLILGVRGDNFIDPRRIVSLPLQMGDRVMSPFRMPGTEGFGGFIIGFVPFTNGAIVLWDNGMVTWDPVSELQPQSRLTPVTEAPSSFVRDVEYTGVGGGARGEPRTPGVAMV